MIEVKLKVEDCKQRDVARGIARIDHGAMQKSEVTAGDVIEIIGNNRTSAFAWPAFSEDQDRGIVKIDGFVYKNARGNSLWFGIRVEPHLLRYPFAYVGDRRAGVEERRQL